ncbi:PTS mannitol transporter subunit IICBA [Brevibacillus laterosporus]|uniref:PTS system mannitol-specific EIICB component n=1 Tax=Brevibacillus laterosporus TaxID=1465 RepID=A0A502HU08_BRELA|nr:PTS mannitol transporter subunit IICBA [Brevibacillus laterosporus]QDX92876.1 PTS mannitol transporter subunit IICBA [Brevibacillus laterosporus]TPG78081.1 PTS mannitol transporter subunit IICBA [Brevibacillus laterosporus]
MKQTSVAQQQTQDTGLRVKVQKFGRFLSGMVMPNIGAFIAWGLITALFIPTGWIPNEELGKMVGPMITYLLPLLIGYTGGKMIYDVRGGVLGAIATMGIIVGAEIPMFLGAMVMGPLGGYVMKKVDGLFEGKIKAGFEMLVNNFSAGILGAILTIIAYTGVGPVVSALTNGLAAGVQAIVDMGLLPLVSIFIEPAKVLFLNNAINHGILGPIGLKEAAEAGKSIFFLLEANPGPGFGILLAYWLVGRGAAKQSAPGAAIIHFLGGIHEIYFPYILMKPKLILAAIGGGISGVFVFKMLGAGLVATASPGSIFAIAAMAPKGGLFPVLAGVVVSTVVSFLLASVFLKASASDEEDELHKATAQMKAMKGNKTESTVVNANVTTQTDQVAANNELPAKEQVKKVIFACDAGMGSSAMGASILRKKFQKAGIDVEVTNKAINDLPKNVDIVVTHKSLTERAQQTVPQAHHISVDNFLSSPKYDELTTYLSE